MDQRGNIWNFFWNVNATHVGEGGRSGKASFQGGILRQGWGVQDLRIRLGGPGTLTALTRWAALTWVPVPGLPPSARLPPGYPASSHFLISPQEFFLFDTKPHLVANPS